MRAIICGYYGQGNGGDEALLVSLLQMLPSHVTPVVLSANPLETSTRYGVESCHGRAWWDIFQHLRRGDIFIWGGGSLMQDSSGWASPWYYAGLMAIASGLGLKTIAWAQGIGPLYRVQTRWLTRWILGRCTAVSVRDRASAALLQQWHIPHGLAPDPVWLLADQPCPNADTIPLNAVAVNLRRHSQLTPARLQLLTEALIDFQQATQTFILLVPFQKSQDGAIAEAIATQLNDDHQIIHREDPRELKALFCGVRLTIGMRLHSLIMAAAVGDRCFALSYDPKVTRLMEEVGLPGWELTALPPTAADISSRWQRAFYEGHPLDSKQFDCLRQHCLEHQRLLERVCQA